MSFIAILYHIGIIRQLYRYGDIMGKKKYKPSAVEIKAVERYGGLGLNQKTIAGLMGYTEQHFSQVIMKENKVLKDAYLKGKSKALSLLVQTRKDVALDSDHKHWEKANISMIERMEKELDSADVEVVVDDSDILASIKLELSR
jgi:hypothetical protein